MQHELENTHYWGPITLLVVFAGYCNMQGINTYHSYNEVDLPALKILLYRFKILAYFQAKVYFDVFKKGEK